MNTVKPMGTITARTSPSNKRRTQDGDRPMSTNILFTGDGRRIEVDIPDEAVEAAEEWAGQDIEIALANAAPFIIAAELRRIAGEAHEAAQNFDTANLKVRKDDYLTFARALKQRADHLDGGR